MKPEANAPCPACAEGHCPECLVIVLGWDMPGACGCEVCQTVTLDDKGRA